MTGFRNMQVMTTDTTGPTSPAAWPERVHDSAASRWLIAGSVLVVLVWIIVVVQVRPGSFVQQSVLDFVPVLLSVAAVAAFVIPVKDALRGCIEPQGFVVREGIGFAAVASRGFDYLVVGQVLMVGLLGSSAIRQWTTTADRPAAFGLIDYGLAISMSVMSVVLGVFVTVLVIAALAGRPRIELTPRAVVLREPLGIRAIPWDALRPGLSPTFGGAGTLALTIDRPEIVVRRGVRGSSSQVALAYARVHPLFLADAIRYYVDRPDRRDDIGTWAGYERLLADLGVVTGRQDARGTD